MDLDLEISRVGDQVVYGVTFSDKRLVTVLGYWVAEKQAELLSTVDIGNINEQDRLSLETTKALVQKIKHAQDNPIWDIRTVRGVVSSQDSRLFLVCDTIEYQIESDFVNEISAREGKLIIARGVVKTPTQFEVRGFLDVKEMTLELFVMSQCPYGIQAEELIIAHVLSLDSEDRPELEVHYLFYEKQVGDSLKLVSMHGEEEVLENLIQMAIRDEYPDSFFDYLLARADDTDARWQDIADHIGMSGEQIESVQSTVNTNRYLMIEREHDYVTGTYGIFDGSPSFVWECERVIDIRTLEPFKGFEFTTSQCNDEH